MQPGHSSSLLCTSMSITGRELATNLWPLLLLFVLWLVL
jgi:hypothetical protein